MNDLINFARNGFAENELHVLFFILSVFGCLSYESTIAKIGPVSCKFE